MHYNFPHITHISDVLPAIENSKEFIVAEKDHYTVVNYVVSTPDTFPEVNDKMSAIRRECRGITFCSQTGKILARKFHKFFNVNEKSETQIIKVDLSRPHVIMEKLDGSMITPIAIKTAEDMVIRWTTKMGITDVAQVCEEYVVHHHDYVRFAEAMIEDGFSPIFEWCSRKNQIVLDYPEDRLVLLALRQMTTGEYVEYDVMKNLAENWNIPVVHVFDMSNKSMGEIADTVHKQEDSEGIIIRFTDDHMVKIKSAWYVQLHKAKQLLDNEKNLVAAILDANVDDLKSFLNEQQLVAVCEFENQVWSLIQDNAVNVFNASNHFQNICGGDRKIFAIEHANNLDPHTRQMIFRLWDCDVHDKANLCTELVTQTLRNHLSSNKKYDIIKVAFNIPDIKSL